MLSSIQPSSSSIPIFLPIFEKALEEYKKKTGKDLTAHPLAAQINACDSPEAILTVLEGKANELNQSRSSDERLTKWLNPTVNILNVLSATLGEGAGSVFPPTKIIFSGISILLDAAKSTVANRDVLVKLFGRIETFFERLKIYTKVPPSPAVTDELAKIMAEVLLILGTATKGIKEGRTKIFLKKVAGMNDLEDALQRFAELEQRELLTGVAQVSSDTNVLKDDAKEMKAMLKEIVNKMDAHDWEGVLQKLERWLSPPDPSTNYNIGLRDLHEETATWFLEDGLFQEWHSTSSLLWIHGKPGSGKSILCSAIIQRIRSLCDGGRACMAYFYFDFRDENKKHRHNLLPSLLVQFTAHSIPCCDIISRVYAAHGKGTQQPSDDVLIDCLTNMLSAMTQHPIYIILDALDESPNASGVRSARERVLSLIQDLVNLCLPNLHICVTSRPEIDIRIRLEPLTSYHVSLHDQTGHKQDIANYIRSEIDFIAKDKRWREDDKRLVIETLSEKADGMFRWVFCQLERLRRCLSSRVRQFLNGLPKSLDETYERILKGIPEENRKHSRRLLQCLTVAVRPLRVEELAEILTFEFDATEEEAPMFNADWRSEDQEQELLSACPSLITIVGDYPWRVVQFSHFSVKEFLTSDRLATSSEDISCYHILPDAAHTTLAQASLGVLLRVESARSNHLASYAAKHWVSHAQVGSVSSRVMGAMKTLFDLDKPHFAAWIQRYDIDKPFLGHWNRSVAKPLYYSALCGFNNLVTHLLKKNSQHVNALGGTEDYPLVAALHGGHIQVAELLIQHGASVDVQGRDEQTPLHNLIQQSNSTGAFGTLVGTVQLLLKHGSVQFLCKHGADINAKRKDLSTPLHLAANLGHLSAAQTLVQVLIDHGANVNMEDNEGCTPLHRASTNDGNGFGVVQLLVEHGADVNARDKYHRTPLHMASSCMTHESVRVLIDHGADVNAEDIWGHTPLHDVLEDEDNFDDSEEDGSAIVLLLLQRGADVNKPDQGRKTPLHLASRLVLFEVAWILLKHGADPNVENKEGKVPFQLVRESVREQMSRYPSKYSIGQVEGRARRAEVVALMSMFYNY